MSSSIGRRSLLHAGISGLLGGITLAEREANAGTLYLNNARYIRNLTGPWRSIWNDLTGKFAAGYTDLGIPVLCPNGTLLLVCGDTFVTGTHDYTNDWRAPVGLRSSSTNLNRIVIDSCVGSLNHADSLVPEPHLFVDYNGPNGSPRFTTAIPSDVFTIGNTMYMHLMRGPTTTHITPIFGAPQTTAIRGTMCVNGLETSTTFSFSRRPMQLPTTATAMYSHRGSTVLPSPACYCFVCHRTRSESQVPTSRGATRTEVGTGGTTQHRSQHRDNGEKFVLGRWEVNMPSHGSKNHQPRFVRRASLSQHRISIPPQSKSSSRTGQALLPQSLRPTAVSSFLGQALATSTSR